MTKRWQQYDPSYAHLFIMRAWAMWAMFWRWVSSLCRGHGSVHTVLQLLYCYHARLAWVYRIAFVSISQVSETHFTLDSELILLNRSFWGCLQCQHIEPCSFVSPGTEPLAESRQVKKSDHIVQVNLVIFAADAMREETSKDGDYSDCLESVVLFCWSWLWLVMS